ncbi:molybdopterin dinucleotide binding domain-containing protein, partial [Paraburkholderia sp. SIMBA_053]
RRVEFYSEKLHRYGYPAVPHYVPPSRGEVARAAERRRFPYTLTSFKNGYYCHSQHRSLPSLRRRAPYPVAELSADLAAVKGIVDGDWIR